jgi:hypothetical protein
MRHTRDRNTHRGDEGGVVGPRGGVTSGGGSTGVAREAGVGVKVAVADIGVVGVPILGVGEGERPGIVSVCPSANEFGSAILL